MNKVSERFLKDYLLSVTSIVKPDRFNLKQHQNNDFECEKMKNVFLYIRLLGGGEAF